MLSPQGKDRAREDAEDELDDRPPQELHHEPDHEDRNDEQHDDWDDDDEQDLQSRGDLRAAWRRNRVIRSNVCMQGWLPLQSRTASPDGRPGAT